MTPNGERGPIDRVTEVGIAAVGSKCSGMKLD